MITSFQELFDARPAWNTIMVVYLRFISILLLIGGIIYWGRIVGLSEWRGMWFWEMPVSIQGAVVFFAVLDLVAAIGLWLAVSWGTVMWIFRCFCQILMHTAFVDLYGSRPYEIAFYLLTMAIYAGIYYQMEREKKQTED